MSDSTGRAFILAHMLVWACRKGEREGRGRGGGIRRISISTLINHKGWVFEGVHNSYTVVLATATRSSPSSAASIPDSGHSTMSTADTPSQSSPPASRTRALAHGGGFDADTGAASTTSAQAAAHDDASGSSADADLGQAYVAIYPGPARSLAHFGELVDGKPELIGVTEFLGWSNTAAFPQIPTREAFRVWRRMRRHPRFSGAGAAATHTHDFSVAIPASPRRPQRHDGQVAIRQRRRSWSFRPVAELHATHDRHRFMNDDGASARSESLTPPATEDDS